MNIEISVPKLFSFYTKNNIEDAVKFYFENYFTDWYKFKSTNLYIIFVDNIISTSTENTDNVVVVGKAYPMDDKYIILIKSNIDYNDIIITLFHELTHIKQYCEKRFILDKTAVLWNNKKLYLIGKHIAIDTYINFPWEIEARDVEKDLFKLWKSKQTFWNKIINYIKYSIK
jgi:hypothetical protein